MGRMATKKQQRYTCTIAFLPSGETVAHHYHFAEKTMNQLTTVFDVWERDTNDFEIISVQITKCDSNK